MGHGDGHDTGGGAAARPFAAPAFDRRRTERRFELAVDLGIRIGSRRWWRGLATLAALIGAVACLAPGLPVLPARPAYPPPAPAIPRAAPDLTRRLVLGHDERLDRLLVRGGASASDAREAARLILMAMPVPAEGLSVDLTLGAPAPDGRVLRRVSLRGALDLALTVRRAGTRLVLDARAIPVDATPLRLGGTVAVNLYRTARDAGVPPTVLIDYLSAIGERMNIDEIARGDRFDLVVEQSRAATGERRTGRLLYGALTHGRHVLRLMPWTLDTGVRWFDQDGAGAARQSLTLPVNGALTSGFGPRFHPILGYSRMHEGIDLAAPEGTAIVAAADGVVRFAGWHGGHGNYVLVDHAGGMATGYGHMSRFVVAAGDRIRQGQLLGYVGSTGLSTGPHCHFEVFRDGQPIDPTGASLTTTPRLAGAALARFRAAMAGYAALPEKTGMASPAL